MGGMNLLVELIGERRLSEIYRRHAARQVREGMKAEFQDGMGRWYYSFRDDGDIPIARTSAAHTHMQYMAAGLDAETWKKAMSTITELLAKSEIVKAGAVINDMTDLEKKIINFDAVINIIAVHYVREDEDTGAISDSIHAEKCDFLKSETEEGRFFFRLPMFARLLNQSTISKEDASKFWTDYMEKRKTVLRRMSSLISDRSAEG